MATESAASQIVFLLSFAIAALAPGSVTQIDRILAAEVKKAASTVRSDGTLPLPVR